MELPFHKWFQAAEIDAKTVEHMLAATSDLLAVDRIARELISARTRIRILDAREASVHARIMSLESALSTIQTHELAAHRSKLIEKILQRYKSDKRDFLNRREEWQARLNKTMSPMTELSNMGDQQFLQTNPREIRVLRAGVDSVQTLQKQGRSKPS